MNIATGIDARRSKRTLAMAASLFGALFLVSQAQGQALQNEMIREFQRQPLRDGGRTKIEWFSYDFEEDGFGEMLTLGIGPHVFPDKLAFMQVYGDNDGRVYTFARTGVDPYRASVRLHWSKTYAKGESDSLSSFTVLPSWLELYDGGGQGYIRNLVAEFVIVVLLDGREVFKHFAQIRGKGGLFRSADKDKNHTFALTNQIPGDPSWEFTLQVTDCSECEDSDGNPIPREKWDVPSARYDIDGLTQALDLSGYSAGEPFTVDYQLASHVWGDGGETIAEAFIGDPLEVETGVTLDTSELIEVAGSGTSANCDTDFPATTPTSQFGIAGALATDLVTGLQWSRCPEGTPWDDAGTPADPLDDTCLAGGTTNFTWQDALQQVQAINLSGTNGGGWRLPNVKELASIVELQCGLPAVNTEVFPGMANAAYWTNSPDMAANGGAVWTVNFVAGAISAIGNTATLGMILVRDAVPVLEDMLFSDGFEGQ